MPAAAEDLPQWLGRGESRKCSQGMDAKLDVDASMEGIAWLGIGWVRARICYIFGVTELPVSERVLCH